MRRRVAIFLALACLISPAAAQSTSSALARFLGSWTGSFQDRPLVRISLATRDGRLTGTVSHPTNIKIDDAGEVSEAAAELADSQVVGGVVSGDTLRIICREASGEQVQYEMTVAGGSAELKLLDVPPEYNLKPWKLVRAGGKS